MSLGFRQVYFVIFFGIIVIRQDAMSYSKRKILVNSNKLGGKRTTIVIAISFDSLAC